MHGIQTVHIRRRISFGIPHCLRLRQGGREIGMLQFHAGENVIAGAVDNSVNMGNAISHKPFAQGFDNRNPSAHTGFVIQIGPVLPRRREQFLAVGRKQRLVGGDHRLAQAERRQNHRPGHRCSADQLNDGVNPRVLHHAAPIGGHERGWDGVRARLIQRLDRHFAQTRLEAEPRFQQRPVPVPMVPNTTAHRPAAD